MSYVLIHKITKEEALDVALMMIRTYHESLNKDDVDFEYLPKVVKKLEEIRNNNDQKMNWGK